MHVTIRTSPHRQRRAPVALARDRPVDVVGQPVPEAPVLDAWGVPVDRLVRREHLLAYGRRADVPGGLRVVDQRRSAPPAVRVGVLVVLYPQQQIPRAQVLDQLVRQLRVLDEAARVAGNALIIGAVWQDGVVQRARSIGLKLALGGGDTVVVLAKRRRDMHNARAVLGRHKRIGNDRKSTGLPSMEDRTRIGPVSVDQLCARESLLQLPLCTQHRLDPILGEHERLISDPHPRVGGRW